MTDTTSTPVFHGRPQLPSEAILTVENVIKRFARRRALLRRGNGWIHAVDGVTLEVASGETLGVVGESGSGKSTLALLVMRLLDPSAGRILFRGTDITAYDRKKMRAVRREMQIVFQNPYGSLDQRMRVEKIVGEPLEIHGVGSRRERRQRVHELLEMVGMDMSYTTRLPRELSGGQQQRVAIARALALRPRLLILDEPVSALDVSVQAQVINLLKQIQREQHLTFIFISHDLSVVHHIADRVAVMYLGKIIERGSCTEVFEAPLHPYTRALLSAAPVLTRDATAARPRIVLHGDLPSAADPPSGCRFRTRCWKAQSICASQVPELLAHRGDSQVAACHFPENDSQQVPPAAARA